jgi:hypothetical protein
MLEERIDGTETHMKTIVLIACAAKKVSHRARAAELYVSPLFTANLRYARSLRPDAIYILSAKHGLLALDQEVEPYDLTLNTMPVAQVRAWAGHVVAQLRGQADLQNDRFILLAGSKYRKFIVPHLAHWEAPLEGMRIGEQLQWLGRQ